MVSNAAVQSLSDDFTSKPVTLQDGWQVASTACVAEGTTGRALTGASFADDSMLPAKCMSFCKDKGFRLAGVEYGREVSPTFLGGNELDINGSVTAVPSYLQAHLSTDPPTTAMSPAPVTPL